MELNTVLTSIAESLHEERVRAGLTLEQLARRAELSTAHLSRLESGDRQPSVAALLSLARALGVSLSWLLGERHTGSTLAVYEGGGPTREANGLTISACSGFPGSTTLEALHITIDPDRVPPAPARHRGEEWIHVIAGHLRLDYDDEVHLLRPGELGALRRQPAPPPGRRAGDHRGGGRGRRRTQGAAQPSLHLNHLPLAKEAPMTMLGELEATGERFSLDRLMEVRARTRKAVHLIADQVEVGMVEEDAKAMARATLSELGMRRGWHHIIVRFGPNTTKDFMEPSEKGVVLGSDDIFFVDIGPVYEDTEGDAGDTFVVGSDPEHLRAKREVRTIWDRVRDQWFAEGTTGKELYDYATETADEFGWRLNLDLSGHRLSDFPHSAHYDGPLAEVEFRPNPNLWVLEIAIIHRDRKFGAFYEDLLLEDQSFPE